MSLGSILWQKIRDRVRLTVVAQDTAVERVLVGLLTGGHVLLQGNPGVAKTLLVKSIACALGLTFKRIQFTIDLLPADILGAPVWLRRREKFVFDPGPIFANLVLADEINRASPRVQSALLEAMQEYRVTIRKKDHPLPLPFMVIATQNPVEQAGTFELPEAQLDRFLFCHRIDYPKADTEAKVVEQALAFEPLEVDAPAAKAGMKAQARRKSAGKDHEVPSVATQAGSVSKAVRPRTHFENEALSLPPVASEDELKLAMREVRQVRVGRKVIDQTVALIAATRDRKQFELGCSPRGSLGLILAARARAYLQGREDVTPLDVFELAKDVMLHRLRPTSLTGFREEQTEKMYLELLNKFLTPETRDERDHDVDHRPRLG
jgi:MoxR-like ATPase